MYSSLEGYEIITMEKKERLNSVKLKELQMYVVHEYSVIKDSIERT